MATDGNIDIEAQEQENHNSNVRSSSGSGNSSSTTTTSDESIVSEEENDIEAQRTTTTNSPRIHFDSYDNTQCFLPDGVDLLGMLIFTTVANQTQSRDQTSEAG